MLFNDISIKWSKNYFEIPGDVAGRYIHIVNPDTVNNHTLCEVDIKAESMSWWWKQFPRCWYFVRRIHRSPVNSTHKGQWRSSLMFSLICVWINDWVNSREAGDLRRHRAHYDVTVMWKWDCTKTCYSNDIMITTMMMTTVLMTLI